jgi:hypothetical protein
MIVTTATFASPEDIEAMAPIWQDANGVKYRVTSGLSDDLPEGAWSLDIDSPAPSAPAVIAGPDGLTALALMGLVPL